MTKKEAVAQVEKEPALSDVFDDLVAGLQAVRSHIRGEITLRTTKYDSEGNLIEITEPVVAEERIPSATTNGTHPS